MWKYLRNARLGKISFRDILLWRILLLSIPVLLLGQYVTYRKARSTLLETARQNLTESAISEGSRISEAIAAWQGNLLTATETSVLQSGSREASAQYLNKLASRWPVECLQLQEIETGAIAASTCGDRPFAPVELSPHEKAAVRVVFPETAKNSEIAWQNRLDLILSAPVRDQQGNDRFQLVVEFILPLQLTDEPKSLTGYTVIINQDGTIIAHPDLERVGQNIVDEKNEETRKRLSSLVRNAIEGEQYFQHVLGFDDSGKELLTGYTAIDSPTDKNGKWVILAVTSLDNALFGLQEILQTLINLILLLIAANLVATLFLARDLARPMEKLGKYARNVEGQEATASIPHNFKIEEFNELALALNSMVSRLKAWAEELQTAWQEAKVANQLKNEFLASISHELRTPLNAIIGSVRLVLDDYCDDREEEKEFLQQVDDAAVHLLEIINDILDIAKIEAGTFSVAIERLDLLEVLKEAVDLQMVEIQQKGLQLHWDKGRHGEAIAVQADKGKLKQVFLNVLSNAIKFTKTGGITITTRISAPSSSEGQTYVTVVIKDTGIGVGKSEQSKLFQPFVMADGSRTRQFGGAGLGLAISRNLMELMQGNITLSSEGTEKGSTVEVSLPVMKNSPLPKSSLSSS
ncbi:MAG: ATP-binding protein [Hormoscilla sp.]